ncbi:MAG: hypothetical protein U0412_03490 [Nitrospira sp.]
MYRRDISSILRIMAVLLGLFVLYHIWPQPSQPPSVVSTSMPQEDSTTTPSFPPALVEPTPSFELPRTRLIDPGEAPSAVHQALRDHFDRGEYRQTEAALRELDRTHLVTPRQKAYVAALWNNLGVQQEQSGGIQSSVKAFKEAATLAPRNPTALLNLTQAYWGLRSPALTASFLETVIQVAPEDPFPHLALAELLIDKGHPSEARPHLVKAKRRIAKDPTLAALLDKLESRSVHTAAAAAQRAKAVVVNKKTVPRPATPSEAGTSAPAMTEPAPSQPAPSPSSEPKAQEPSASGVGHESQPASQPSPQP